MLFICYRYPNIVDESTFSALSNWLSRPLSHQGKLIKGHCNMPPSYKGKLIIGHCNMPPSYKGKLIKGHCNMPPSYKGGVILTLPSINHLIYWSHFCVKCQLTSYVLKFFNKMK
jgi:hypothetical protein